MLAHTPYAEELTFLDCYEGRAIPTVALFQLSIVAGELLSEDRSFCGRWRALEEPIYMYLGRGSPVTHHGEYAFRGHPEAFGIRHL
jgi:hypothetical protein